MTSEITSPAANVELARAGFQALPFTGRSERPVVGLVAAGPVIRTGVCEPAFPSGRCCLRPLLT
jgi:hypothetical protein